MIGDISNAMGRQVHSGWRLAFYLIWGKG